MFWWEYFDLIRHVNSGNATNLGSLLFFRRFYIYLYREVSLFLFSHAYFDSLSGINSRRLAKQTDLDDEILQPFRKYFS